MRFAITPVRAAVVVLHDEAGQPLPLGSEVRLEGAPDAQAMVGYDGETYLDALGQRNRLTVRIPGDACAVEFDYAAANDAIPRIGPLTCKMELSP